MKNLKTTSLLTLFALCTLAAPSAFACKISLAPKIEFATTALTQAGYEVVFEDSSDFNVDLFEDYRLTELVESVTVENTHESKMVRKVYKRSAPAFEFDRPVLSTDVKLQKRVLSVMKKTLARAGCDL